MTRRVLVSHKLNDVRTGDSHLDTKLNEWQRGHAAEVFERFRYHAQYSPDHEISSSEIDASVTPTAYEHGHGNILRYDAESGANSSTGVQASIDQSEIGYGNYGAAPVTIPFGRYVVNASLSIGATTSIYGSGYASTLQLTNAATHRALLVEHASYTAINGIRLRDFRIDGNAGGVFDSGLIQCNNAVGFVADGLWIQDGSRASGASGVNGFATSSGNGSGAGPSGTLLNSYFSGMSKGAINVSTDSDGVTAAFNISKSNTGNGTAPGLQIFDAYRTKFIGNVASGNQGRGIFGNINSADGANAYSIVALNHSYGNGTGSTEGDGIAYTNTSGAERHARAVILGNVVTDNGDGLASGGSGINITAIKSVDVCHQYIYDNALHGVLLSASSVDGGHIRVCDNHIDNNNTKTNASGAGVFVIGTFDTLEICRNKITNSDASSRHRYGVYFDDSCVINDLTLRDNTVTEMVTGNYYFGSSGPATFTRFDISVQGRHQTDDANQDTVFAFPLPDDSACYIKLSAVGVQSDGTNRAAYERAAVIYRDGGNATIQSGAQTSLFSQESDTDWDASISVTSTLMVVLIRGDTSQTVNWRWKVEAYSI